MSEKPSMIGCAVVGFVPPKHGPRGPNREARNVSIIEKAKRDVASGECVSMRAAIKKHSPDEVSSKGVALHDTIYRAYLRYRTPPRKKRS